MCAYLETSKTFCSQPVCSEGCSREHGYCREPDTCLCLHGYSGDNCTEPVTLSSCKNGHSSFPDKHCTCDHGWIGELCETPVCLSGCNSKQGYCNVPDECLCKLGWTGATCEQCVPYPGCDELHGTCQKPWECICQSGWEGDLCDTETGITGQTIFSTESSTTQGKIDQRHLNVNLFFE